MVFRVIKSAFVFIVLFTITTGMIYPAFITATAQLLFPNQANGSMVLAEDGSLIGSSLIGQSFSQPEYFWGRLSATPEKPYNASASGGSNYSILNDALMKQAKERIEALRAADPQNPLPIPVDLVTASGSGLDPHISPASAYYQSSRVARARGLETSQVDALISSHIEQPFLDIWGEPRINVMLLNLALDELQLNND